MIDRYDAGEILKEWRLKYLTGMEYPFFIAPNDHHLDKYYRKLNKWGWIVIALLFALNEVFFRTNLPVFLNNSNSIGSLLPLTLNASLPSRAIARIYIAMALLSFAFAVTYYFLPKWGYRPSKLSIKRGLPPHQDYGISYFYVENSIQGFAHAVWHSMLMRVSWLSAVLMPCILINTLRGSS
jgi:hypothetical protein